MGSFSSYYGYQPNYGYTMPGGGNPYYGANPQYGAPFQNPFGGGGTPYSPSYGGGSPYQNPFAFGGGMPSSSFDLYSPSYGGGSPYQNPFAFGGGTPSSSYAPYPPYYGGGSQFPPFGGGSPYPPYGGDPSAMWGMFQPLLQCLLKIMNKECHCKEEGGEGDHGNKNTGENAELLERLQEFPMLEYYTQDGKITREGLEALAGSWQAPEQIRRDALELAENESLFNLLVLGSGEDPADEDAGIELEFLQKGKWEDLPVDHVEDFKKDPAKAVEVLKEHAEEIAKLGKDPENITVEDLKEIALGEVAEEGLKDSKLRTAALQILSDAEVLEGLDEYDDGDPNTKPDNTTKETFHKNAFAEWLAAHADEEESH